MNLFDARKFEEKHISKSNEQFQLQLWYVFLCYNIIRYLQQIFHIYTAAICTPLNSYHNDLLWKKNMKKISFIQPSRNNLKYLQWSYNSIRKNLGYIHEICMADDFSNDGTWEWLEEISKKILQS